MKNFGLLWVFLFVFYTASSQSDLGKTKPKLVVGIVVDQMRYDYLTRFYSKYGNDGFKRLISQGYNCENAHFNYVPTYTAVGHTSIYTGTTPDIHGIISNNWYDKELKKSIYCVDDNRCNTVGAKSGGEKSPYRMQTTSITDALHLSQNMNGKVIGISIKDRASILPAGHTANAAYWFQGEKTGGFISSSYYMEKLPKWVEKFNKSGVAEKYINQKWETLYPIDTYTESIADDNEFEATYKDEKRPVFPHDLKKLKKKNNYYNLIKSTPFGNSILVDFAEQAILSENLGKGKYTDFLTISFSSTDYIGHQFGVDSKEVEDTYLRLDKDIARLLKILDKEVGKGNYTLFLTADHAAVQVPSFMKSLKIPAGYFDAKDFEKYLRALIEKKYHADLVENFSNFQIFFNKSKLAELNLKKEEVEDYLTDEIITYPGVFKVVGAHTLQRTNFKEGVLYFIQKGYNQKFSGDVMIVPAPQVISYPKTGSTHGSGFGYDTHVPVIFYGHSIKKGSSNKYIPVINIAPTLANLLLIEPPDGSSGDIISDVIK